MAGIARKVGAGVAGTIVLIGIALVLWNVFYQKRYGGKCSFSLGCRSFQCLKHEAVGKEKSQWHSEDGMCTKSCDADADCGSNAVCEQLSAESREDLPPFGKPDKACLHVRDLPWD